MPRSSTPASVTASAGRPVCYGYRCTCQAFLPGEKVHGYRNCDTCGHAEETHRRAAA